MKNEQPIIDKLQPNMAWQENGIRIFKLNQQDAEWLSTVAKKAYFDHYTHLWFDAGAWYAEKCFNLAQIQEELSDENAQFFGVEDETESLGFLKVNINYPLSKLTCQSKDLDLLTFDTAEIATALELERIYLTQKGQGRGIGRRLVQVSLDVARTHGKTVVWLKAMDTSANAIGFYTQMGFKTCATMRLNYERMKPEMRGMIAMKTNA